MEALGVECSRRPGHSEEPRDGEQGEQRFPAEMMDKLAPLIENRLEARLQALQLSRNGDERRTQYGDDEVPKL